MRKLIVSEFVTLDGVMQAPGSEEGHVHSGWVFDFLGPEQERFKLDEVLAADALLLGRVTYEGFAAAWPARSGEFADKMNSMPKAGASFDELMIFPVVLGSGGRLFAQTPDKTVLKLADTQTFSTGVVVHTYHASAS